LGLFLLIPSVAYRTALLQEVFASGILKYLGKDNDYTQGANPFNRHLSFLGKKIKVCSWVNDMKRLDPIDSSYLISNGVMTTFHRGMKLDEALIMTRNGVVNDLLGYSWHKK
jgi:hypothetical protein